MNWMHLGNQYPAQSRKHHQHPRSLCVPLPNHPHFSSRIITPLTSSTAEQFCLLLHSIHALIPQVLFYICINSHILLLSDPPTASHTVLMCSFSLLYSIPASAYNNIYSIKYQKAIQWFIICSYDKGALVSIFVFGECNCALLLGTYLGLELLHHRAHTHPQSSLFRARPYCIISSLRPSMASQWL